MSILSPVCFPLPRMWIGLLVMLLLKTSIKGKKEWTCNSSVLLGSTASRTYERRRTEGLKGTITHYKLRVLSRLWLTLFRSLWDREIVSFTLTKHPNIPITYWLQGGWLWFQSKWADLAATSAILRIRSNKIMKWSLDAPSANLLWWVDTLHSKDLSIW